VPTPPVTPGSPVRAEPCAGGDPALDRIARVAAAHLGAPTALVAVLDAGEQRILGGAGLPPELDASRALPLADAVALEVVHRDGPVAVPDAATRPAGGLPAASWVAAPLHDGTAGAVGALVVLDGVPRAWSAADAGFLADLAAVSGEHLRVRTDAERAERARRTATEAVGHGRTLLLMAEAFTAATTVTEVTRAVSRVAAIGLGATMTGVALLDPDGQGLTYTSLDAFDGHGVEALRRARIDEDRPVSHVARTRLPVFFRDHAAMVARFPAAGVPDADRARPVPNGGRVLLPLAARGRLLGVLTIGWPGPRDFSQENREVKAALAAYTAQSLERALLLEQRRDVARTLQDAMLTALPQPERFRLAAAYLPAAQADQVGGDWYDGLVLPGGDLAVMVGDVTGHDMDAAARMGQLRSTLRAFAWDRSDAAPSSWLARLDRADHGLGLATVASALAARLTADPAAGGATLRWSSAGHPAPVLVRPGEPGRLLDRANDLLLGVLPDRPRADHAVELAAGDTVVLYTDGLVERRGADLRRGLATLVAEAGRLADREPDAFVRDLTGALVDGRPADDVAVLAVRVLPPA
jgi:serine phosphatase RsbU (regulator of sigma subunit)